MQWEFLRSNPVLNKFGEDWEKLTNLNNQMLHLRRKPVQAIEDLSVLEWAANLILSSLRPNKRLSFLRLGKTYLLTHLQSKSSI